MESPGNRALDMSIPEFWQNFLWNTAEDKEEHIEHQGIAKDILIFIQHLAVPADPYDPSF